ncbi:MAG TPA: hypothetical protein VH280_03810 [Verrucomicrobiae bacterium]|nr:hypothetical protein [Verrucomicrobiae bacterium]
MNDILNQWLDSRLSVPGMLACGIASANMLDSGVGTDAAKGFCRSNDANFSVSQMAHILRLLQDTPTAPDTDISALKWRTWTFTNGKIRSVIRPDGWIFAAVVLANSDAAQILDPLTEEFLALRATEHVEALSG